MRPASNLISAYRPAKSVAEYRNDCGFVISAALFRRVLDPTAVSPETPLTFFAVGTQESVDYFAADCHSDYHVTTDFRQPRPQKVVFERYTKAVIKIQPEVILIFATFTLFMLGRHSD